MEKVKVCYYARVSKDEMDYQRQVNDISLYCQKNNFEIVEGFTEKQSGRIKQRQILTDLMDYCSLNKDKISFVVISELSRLGRTAEVLHTIEFLNDLKIGLISLKENLQTLNADGSPNPTSSLILSILSSINSFELETLKYRVVSGLQSSARNGHWLGGTRLPYGYMRERDSQDFDGNNGNSGKRLVINPTEANIIKNIYDWYIEGKGTRQIATLLNGNDIPTRTGVRWRDKVVYDIIRNPIYIGKRILYKGQGDKEMVLESPQIIDKVIFQEANKIRKENYSKQGINTKFIHLLNGKIIICGICGKSYFAHKRTSGKDNAYKCISVRYGLNCGNYGINIDKLNYAIKYVFLKDLTKLVKPQKDIENSVNSDLAAYDKEMDKCVMKQERLVELYTDGLITKEQYIDRKDRISTQFGKLASLYNMTSYKLYQYNKFNKLFNAGFSTPGSTTDVTKEAIRQVIKSITVTKDDKKLTEIRQDRTVKVDIQSYSGLTLTIYMSQRAKFFIYRDKQIEYNFTKS
jgi:DNA invertase Pin-like site-specific DNA recombinase